MTTNHLSSSQSAEMLAELSRREKEASIKPDPDIDVFMKVREAIIMSNS